MNKKDSEHRDDRSWSWPKDAAQDPGLLWDTPFEDEAEGKDETVHVDMPGFLTDVPRGDAFLQEEHDDILKQDIGTTREHARRRVVGNCLLDVSFGFWVALDRVSIPGPVYGLRWACQVILISMPELK